MANSFAMLLHGEPDIVADILDNTTMDEAQLRAALTNSLRRIAVLERKMAAMLERQASAAQALAHSRFSADG